MLQILLDNCHTSILINSLYFELIFADFKTDEFLDVLWRYNIYKYKQ